MSIFRGNEGSIFGAIGTEDLEPATPDAFGGDGLDLDAFGLDDGVAEAFGLEEDGAELLLQHYGAEDMDFSGTLFSGVDAVDNEGAVEPTELSVGRLAMARRIRRDSAAGPAQAGYVKGVQDALAHFGLAEPALHARMGLLWGEAASGAPVVMPDTFGALAAGKKAPLFDAFSAIEADSAELPPVYVADTAGVRSCLSAGKTKDASASFGLEDRFGDAVLAGFIGGQKRAGSRKAAERLVSLSAVTGNGSAGGHGAAFIEDVEASPHLFSDGTVLDPIYGKLTLCPCPSCSSCSADDVQAGHAKHCGICDGHGGVLIPHEDAPLWSAVRYGSLVPLVIGVGAELIDGLVPAVDSGRATSSKPRPRRRPTFTWSDGPEETEEDVARAIVPERWRSTT